MGRFIYGTMANAVDLDDRVLAHLRVVIMNKLRRSEPFMFDVELTDGSGRRTFWIHPAVPIQLQFFGTRHPRLNRAWIDELMRSASGPHGLAIGPEPADEPVETPTG